MLRLHSFESEFLKWYLEKLKCILEHTSGLCGAYDSAFAFFPTHMVDKRDSCV